MIGRMNHTAFADLSDELETFTLAVAHMQDGKIKFAELVRRKPPFSRDRVVGEFAKTVRTYEISEVYGERFSNGWTTEVLRRNGLRHHRMGYDRPDVLRDFFTLLNDGKVVLPQHEELKKQLLSMQQTRTNHAGEVADLVNVVAGAAVAAYAKEMIQNV